MFTLRSKYYSGDCLNDNFRFYVKKHSLTDCQILSRLGDEPPFLNLVSTSSLCHRFAE